MRMVRLIVASLLLALSAYTTRAEPPPVPETWQAMTDVFNCTVDTHPTQGWCRVFMDTDTRIPWLVFFDQPRVVLFIRTGHGDGLYEYLYHRTEAIGTSL